MAYDQIAINKDLVERETNQSEFQKSLLSLVRKKSNYALDHMGTLHARWENSDYIYRGYRTTDREDHEAASKKEPAKIILPISYAQIQTALGFIFSTFTQRERFIELVATGGEDVKGVEALETDLHYQLVKQNFYPILYCWTLDAFKYGFGIGKVHWREKHRNMRIAKKVPAQGAFGQVFNKLLNKPQEMTTVEEIGKILTYEGNDVSYVSPYSFAVDPNVTIAKFQEGEYVVQEEAVDVNTLKKDEGSYYYGTKHIETTFSKVDSMRFSRRFGPLSPQENQSMAKDPLGRSGSKEVFRREIQITLVPKIVARDDGLSMLGNEDYPIKFLIVTANDGKIIKCERMGYLHDKYTFFVGEYSPDLSSFYNPGLTDTIYELQNTMSFMINSHIVNVRKTIKSRFLYNQDKVSRGDLSKDNMYIPVKPNATGDINKVVKQLDNSDITQGHIRDLDMLNKFVQLVSGVNENALGQYSPGRRSATEAKNVNAGAAARLKMHAILLWNNGLHSMSDQMLSNTRQGRSKEVYEMIVGPELALAAPYERVVLADPTKIAGGYDLLPYDATLPSDKKAQAEILTRLFETLIGNPNSIQMLNKNPMKLMNHIVRLYGIKNINDFNLEELPGQGELPEMSVVPDQVAGDIASQGATPVDPNGENLIRALASA